MHALIATRVRTQECAKPYKTGAITHVSSNRLTLMIANAARALARSQRVRDRFCGAPGEKTFRRRVANACADTVESNVARRRIGVDLMTSFATLRSSHRSCMNRGAGRDVADSSLVTVTPSAMGAAYARMFAAHAAESALSIASQQTRGAVGAAWSLRLVGHLPVTAVPCVRNAGSVRRWGTASRRETSRGHT